MYTPPLFEPNILSTLLRNFSFYFRDGYWGYVFLVIMGLILFPFIWLRAHPAAFSFPDRIYLFNSRSDKMSAVWAFLAFIILCAITYSQEMSLFANFDLMSIGTTVNFAEGKGTGISDIRFSPFGNVELNLFYAVSHNMYIVSGMVLGETALLLYLFYRLFDFIPVSRRLYALALAAFYPALVWINNPIFPERLMLIFICASLLMLKKYLAAPRTSLLILFCILMNLAIYTKETVILFYAGLLAVDVLYLVFRGTVKPASFLHPFKTAKELPLEFIMFQSMAVFAFIYLLFGLGIESNLYVSAHISDEAWKKYYLEIFVCFSALTALVSSQKATPLLLGLLGGSLVLLFFVVWKLGIHNENTASYYAIVSGLFSLFVFFYAAEKKSVLTLFGFAFLAISAIQNISLYRKQNGDTYHDTARFLSRLTTDQKPLSVFVKDSLNGKYESYIIDCYRSAYKFYFPERNFVFKTNSAADRQNNILKFPLKYQERPQPGDIYVENKFYGTDVPENFKLLHENRIFRIFQIK